MAKLIDQQFVQKVQNLVQEILSDESRFLSKKDAKLAPLHTNLFTKNNELPFQNIEPTEREFFRKYFYLDSNVNSPRPEVAFADSPEDQAFFFDQFRQQVKFCTYDYQRLDLLKPSFDEKTDKITFNTDQSQLLMKAVVAPVLHSLEQREIAALEQKKSGKLPTKNDQTAENPYAELADKVLVKGESGQFDVIMTFAQLEEIAGQEAQLRAQGLTQEQVVQLLQEYINKRFPEFKIALTPEGKISTFLGASGVSASASEISAVEQKDGAISCVDLLKEMKYRQTHKMQYDALTASNYNLSFPGASNFQVVGGSTTSFLNGLTIKLDQSEQGNKAVFFLTDRQGVSAKVVVDTTEYRINGKPNFNFSLYQKPEIDSPASPKFKLTPDQLGQLKKPLLLLYKELQKTEDFDPAAEKMSFIKPATKVPPPNIPRPLSQNSREVPTGTTIQAAGASLPNVKTNFSPTLQQPVSSGQAQPPQPHSVGPQTGLSPSIKPKLPANRALLSPTPAKQEVPSQSPLKPANPLQPKQPPQKSISLETTARQAPQKSNKYGRYALAAGLPLAGMATAVGVAAQQLLT